METYSFVATRPELRAEALLFGSNSMHDVLAALAFKSGSFYGAELSHDTGYSRKQVQAELRKLRTIGVIRVDGRDGRAELLRISDDPLADAVVELPALLEASLAALRTNQG
jgi:hypothetical protein